MRCLSTSEAAEMLGVSGATIRNWSKAGHLSSVSRRPAVFTEEDVLALKERIRTNRFNRLKKRANKSASDTFDNPEIRDRKIVADLRLFVQKLARIEVDPIKAFFTAVVHFLADKGETTAPIPANLDFTRVKWRRKPVARIMTDWHRRVGRVLFRPGSDSLRSFLAWRDVDDPLGLLYQGLSSAGEKARTGAFFTPKAIIDDSLATLPARPRSFLDPCCGTGRYLVRAADRFNLAPERLYGFDADPVAVDIAKINVLLRYPDMDFVPNIRCLDSLRDLANGRSDCDTNHLLDSIDAIATNPPWGGCKNRARCKNLAAIVKSGESFSLFLEKSLRLLRPGGALSFLLPESVLKIRTHADIRRLVLEETCIKGITLLGRVFSAVFTQIIRLDLVKRPPPGDWRVQVTGFHDTHTAPQSRFRENAHHAFDVAVTPVDRELMDKVYSVPHQTLVGNAEWALGIVTGDNGRCVLDAPRDGSEPILRGRDIFKYAPRPARCHIVFRPETFQQVAPERFFRAPEKLIYRFVSDRLVFAYDNQGHLTLNSANILIPRLPDLPLKAVLAFLNSRVFQYVFTKRFQTRKILRSDLETLPFPLVSSLQAGKIVRQAEKCMGGEYRPAEELDRMIEGIFGITEAEAGIIEERLRSDANRPTF